MKPTKAQAELLAWMVKEEKEALESQYRGTRERASIFRGGDVIGFYAARAARTNHHTKGSRGGGYAQHGWRRAGGTALKNLANRGFVQLHHYAIGVPEYELTDAGREAALEYST